jgi:uncharacterized membrane protein (DUF485 family)
MRDLEPDYRKEYEELLKKVEFFAEIMTLVGVVVVVAMLLNIIIKNI